MENTYSSSNEFSIESNRLRKSKALKKEKSSNDEEEKSSDYQGYVKEESKRNQKIKSSEVLRQNSNRNDEEEKPKNNYQGSIKKDSKGDQDKNNREEIKENSERNHRDIIQDSLNNNLLEKNIDYQEENLNQVYNPILDNELQPIQNNLKNDIFKCTSGLHIYQWSTDNTFFYYEQNLG